MAYETIADFARLHEGKDVFILASGPSLGEVDLARLSNRIVVGLNRSSLVYPDTHYHCTMDERLFDQYEEVLRKCRYLFTFENRPFGIPIRLLGSEGFSTDLTKGIYSGYTVSYFALQVAVFMGFRRVFYVGLDLKHQGGKTHFFGTDFVSNDHERTEFPKMKRMLAFGAEQAGRLGVEVYNTSPDSEACGMHRVSFDWATSQ